MSDILIKTTHIDNSELLVYHNSSVVLSTCYPRFMRSLADSIESGHLQFNKPWYDMECGILYVTAGTNVLGHLVYSETSKGILSVINMDADAKVYSTLLQCLEDVARNMGCRAITASIEAENPRAIEAAHSIGLKDVYFQLYKSI